jgi:Nucleoside 2-deoxyribosyltransferase like
MNCVYSDQAPDLASPSLFLAGPTPRRTGLASWRIEAVQILEAIAFAGTVFIPERHDWLSQFDYDDQVEWEFTCLEAATVIVFWIPRDLVLLPGFTTNVEFGRYVSSGRCVYGRPDDAPKNRYLDWLYQKLTRQRPYSALEETLKAATATAMQST